MWPFFFLLLPFKPSHRGSHIPLSWMVHAGCIVARIHRSRTWLSGSFESMRWNACVHRHQSILPSERGNGVRTLVNSKGKIHWIGGSEEDWTHRAVSPIYYHGWEWKILVLLKNKKISSRGPLSWRNSMFVSCVFKRRWRLGGRKCRKMPESDICVCHKAKVVELHIVCMLK